MAFFILVGWKVGEENALGLGAPEHTHTFNRLGQLILVGPTKRTNIAYNSILCNSSSIYNFIQTPIKKLFAPAVQSPFTIATQNYINPLCLIT